MNLIQLKIYNERTENRLNKVINDFDARLDELHNNRMEIAALKSNEKTNENFLNKIKEDVIRYMSIISDAKKLSTSWKKTLDIEEIEELKEYKEKYKELLKGKKDNEEIYADMPYLETEEEAAERIADFNEKI